MRKKGFVLVFCNGNNQEKIVKSWYVI